MNKILKGLFIGGVSALALVGCSNTEVTNDVLVIGMECDYQPFNWSTDTESDYTLPINGTNEYADGYDIQIAKYLSETLDREVVIERITWDNLIPSLQAGTINMILAGMTDTEERRQSIDFTDPYLESDLAFLISTDDLNTYFPGNSEDNPATYEELMAAFANKILVCQANVVGDDFIDTYFTGVDSSIIHGTATSTYPLAALQVSQGLAFAMPAELPVVEAMTNISDSLSVLYVDQSFLSEDDVTGLTVSIGVQKGNTELLDLLNEALANLSTETRATLMGEASTRSASV